MRNLVVAAALASILVGCVTAAEQQQQAAAAMDMCNRTTKTGFTHAQCVNDAEPRMSGENPFLAMKYAYRLQLGQRIDKGEITKEEAQAIFAQKVAELQMQAAR